MLNNDDLVKLVDAIRKRGDRTYTTFSGAFLELIREFAQQGRITEIAEANAIYIQAYPMTSAFISAQVPPILVNSYLPFLADFPYDAFIEWSLVTPNWSEPIRNSFANPRLFPMVVARLIQYVNDFSSQSHN
jgi:hypothetical protein